MNIPKAICLTDDQLDFVVSCFDSRITQTEARREYSFNTKENFVEILYFRHFYRHCIFVRDGEFERHKVVKDYVTVSVTVNLVCVDTNYQPVIKRTNFHRKI